MRVLFVSNSLGSGGAEKLINDLLPLFKEREIRCDLLILTDKGEKYMSNLVSKGIRVAVIPSTVRGHFKRMKFIRDFIFSGNYDVVHANLFPVFYYCSLIKKFNKKKFPHLVMTEHNTDNRRRHKKFLRPIEKWIYRSYDKVISISGKTQESLLQWLKVKNTGKYIVIDNGVPIDAFANAKAIERSLIGSSGSNQDNLICMVGSFTEQKNHKIAIEVIENLPDQYKLILLGEGPLRETIESDVKKKRLDNRVVFLGFRKDVPSIIKACDIMLIPSKWEGFGLVAVEAMACGKPIVASNVPGLAEVVGESGLLCDSRNPEEFAQSILSLENLSRYQFFSQKGLERASEFGIEKMTSKYERVYCEFANSK